MSGSVADRSQIEEQGLAPIVAGIGRCFLVEEFNRILVTRIRWPGFRRGIEVFEEKDDLLPFEEAKLYGHNGMHAVMGYLARLRGHRFIAEVRDDSAVFESAREAALEESGRALCIKHAGRDPLFTAEGFRSYIDDLLERMVNPHLRDSVERVVRDPRRKLGWEDRLVGAMRLALAHGIEPRRFALGAAAALAMLREFDPNPDDVLLDEAWSDSGAARSERLRIARLIAEAGRGLAEFGPGRR